MSALTYMIEELGDARMRCDQLMRYVERASTLVEKSSHKDHFFEVAGDIIRGIPESAFKLHKALQAVALAAGRLDYEEIKQDLRPEKVEELERVLKDVRMRHVQRRSLPNMLNPESVVTHLRSLAKQAREDGAAPTVDLGALIQALEAGAPRVAENVGEKVATQLEVMVHALENPPEGEVPSRVRLAQILRRMVAEHMDLTVADDTADKVARNAKPEGEALMAIETAIYGLKQMIKGGNHKRQMFSVVSSLSKAASFLGQDPRVEEALDKAGHVIVQAWSAKDLADYQKAAAEDEKRSRYEEGKSADPTENMSESDAKAWKDNTEEHKDKFKKEARTPAPDKLFKEMHEAVSSMLTARVYIRHVHEDLGEVRRDASGVFFTDNYENASIKKVEAQLYELDHTIGEAFRNVERLAKDMESMVVSKRASGGEDDKRSRYEEGKSADPTENMSESDAKAWKDNTEEHKDKFKSASRKLEAADSMKAGEWYVQKFQSRGEMYFLAQKEQKNGGWAGVIVDPESRTKAKKDSVPKPHMRQWDKIQESSLPDNVKDWGKKRMASDDEGWKAA